jgi:hypothetical protein
MSRKKFVLIASMVLLLVASLIPVAVHAQSATAQAWSTAITYYTPSDTGGTLQIRYFQEGSATSIDAAPIVLSPHKAGSLFIGAVPGMTSTFKGGAVLEADVPIVATAVNIAGDAASYPRPLYSGFDPSQASPDFLIPTVLFERFNTNSLVSIQNVESTSINATLRVYAAGSATPAFEDTYAIPAQSAKLIAASDMGLATGFTGSGTIEATGRVVAAAQETDNSGRGAAAFEGLAADAGATELYMASMQCRAFAGNTSYYAIQNAGTAEPPVAATVEIDFYDKTGALLHTATGLSIDQGNKISENPCKYTGSAPALEGVSGSAVIRSTNGQPLIAVGKIAGGGLSPTAFLGQSQGFNKSAAPYIRWKANPAAGERAYIAVMNVGTGDATDVQVKYYDNQANLAATHVLATGASPLPRFIKANTNPAAAGALDGNGDFGVNPYGGAIEISSDQPVVVVVRIAKTVSFPGYTMLAEDYNGVQVP